MRVLNDNNFAEETKEGNFVVDFYADWCGPCKMIAPILEEFDSEVNNVKIVKVDVDVSAQVAMKYAVRSIPTLVFLKDGVEVDRIIGAPTKQTLKQKFNELF
jgi:thioredoxin 1